MNTAETNTVIAALRFFQAKGAAEAGPEILDIATGDRTAPALTAEQIDALCERLNTSDADIRIVVHVEGGAVQSVLIDPETSTGANIRAWVLDYDIGDSEETAWITQDDGRKAEALVHEACVTSRVGILLSDVYGGPAPDAAAFESQTPSSSPASRPRL